MRPLEALSEAIALTECMYRAAELERWEEVGEVNRLRDTLLHNVFAAGPVTDATLTGLLARLYERDSAILALAEKERRERKNRVLAGAAGRRAARAYGGVRRR